MRACLRRNTPGPYQIQAAINAVHSDAPTAARHRLAPDRRRSTTSCSPSPRRRSSRSTGPSPSPRSTGPAPAWPRSTRSTSTSYHLFHATRADLLRRLGRRDEAARPTTGARPGHQRRRAPLPGGAADHYGGRQHVSKEQRGAHTVLLQR